MLPQRVLGRDLFWWLTRLGLMRVNTVDPARPPGAGPRGVRHRYQPPPPPAGRCPVPARGWSTPTGAPPGSPTAAACEVGRRHLGDRLPVRLLLDRHPRRAADGRVVHRRGVTDVPGLYFLGLSWQHTRGSALLGFVADDAAYLTEQIATRAGANRPSQVASGHR